jgi:hypothetical protein
MSSTRRIAFVVGLLAVLVGLVWIGQGTGVFPYPKESFMIDQRPWAWRGLAVAVAGLVLAGLARAWRSR